MFLRCSYFFPNLSLHVLIDLVLNQKNACTNITDSDTLVQDELIFKTPDIRST